MDNEMVQRKGERKKAVKRQEATLRYLKEFTAEHGYPPTVREICAAVNLASTSTVYGHLLQLEKKGYIRRDPTKPRAIEILDTGLSGDSGDTAGGPDRGLMVWCGEGLSPSAGSETHSGPEEPVLLVMTNGSTVIGPGGKTGVTYIVRDRKTLSTGWMAAVRKSGRTYIGNYQKMPSDCLVDWDTAEVLVTGPFEVLGEAVMGLKLPDHLAEGSGKGAYRKEWGRKWERHIS